MTKICKLLIALLSVVMIFNVTGCAVAPTDDTLADNPAEDDLKSNLQTDTLAAGSSDLMTTITSNAIEGLQPDANFVNNIADFSIDLFKKSISDSENALVSPISVVLALAMTANGAQGDTLNQMEQLLGGNIPLQELNKFLYSYTAALPNTEKSKFHIANSIWIRDDSKRLQVNPVFLQKNADYFNAAAFIAAFDDQTVQDINNWVNTNTDGMIDSIIEEIDSLSMIFLINAITFDAEWETIYDEFSVGDGNFTDVTGTTNTVSFMHSTESIFIDDGLATGFAKPYADGGFSFVAMLPNDDVSLYEYIESLTGEHFINMIQNAESTTVITAMPKFDFDFTIDMNEALITLGMPDAFDDVKADFNEMAVSTDGNLYISQVLHKTFISVDESGTRAGAATSVAIAGTSAPLEMKYVTLDRPFVFAIIDNATGLPMFIGTVLIV